MLKARKCGKWLINDRNLSCSSIGKRTTQHPRLVQKFSSSLNLLLLLLLVLFILFYVCGFELWRLRFDEDLFGFRTSIHIRAMWWWRCQLEIEEEMGGTDPMLMLASRDFQRGLQRFSEIYCCWLWMHCAPLSPLFGLAGIFDCSKIIFRGFKRFSGGFKGF